MKKSLIALAIAALSSNAFAADFTKSPVNTAKYASEITMPGVLKGTESLDATFELGFSVIKGTTRYIRIDLTNAEFEGPVTTDSLTFKNENGSTPVKAADGTTDVTVAHPLSSGGTKGSKYVIFEITPSGGDLLGTKLLTLDLTNLKATGGDIGIKYSLYQTGWAASAGNSETLDSASGTLVSFTPALSVTAKQYPLNSVIDVNQLSTYFYVNNVSKRDFSNFGDVVVGFDNKVLTKEGAPVTTVSDLVKSAKLEVSGDFSAGKKTDGKLVPAALKLDGVDANTITATKATFDSAITGGPLEYTVDTTTALTVGAITAVYTPVAQDGYTLPAVNLKVGDLTKNGSSAEANLVLAPDTAFTNLVRISNTSGVAGKLYITAIVDDGKSVTFPLSDVAGQPASLNPGASTKQMKVKDIFAAAEAKGLALTGDKKLRLKVEGEVGSLSLQTYTVSKDGNALNSLNAFN